MADLLLQVKDVSKTFPGVKALDHVNLQIGYGEVHGLIGENGAGKSTIIKIIAGIYEPDEGQITFMGKTCQHESIRQSLSRGISVIYQELCLVPHMKVYENIMLGYEGLKHGGYSAEKARARAAAILEQLGLELPLDAYVRDLDIAVQQMIEIAKAFSRDVKLIIMDEPTSSLTNKEVDQLYKIIRNLKREGISTLFVSHKLEEIEEICDCLTVFRDGKTITSAKVGEITPDEMVYAMVGREITNYYTTIHKPQSEVVMELKGLGKAGVIEDVSFALHKGEVLGMTGLIGAGRTETAHMLFGLDTFETGQLLLEGKSVRFKSTHDALAAGVALVPENRKEQGIIPQMGVGFNITISVLEQFMHLARVDHAKENGLIGHFFQALKIKAYSPEQLISNLSGGNQQKAIIARWLAAKPKVLILDEPTRGIDIGAKKEIYELIDQLAQEGVAILLISSELPEVINMSDRIVVMRQGRAVAVLEDKAQFDQENIIRYSL